MRLNDCKFIGNLVDQPEVRETASGMKVCGFNIAVNNFDREKDALFVKVKTFRNTADFVGSYLEKGSPVFVSGQLNINRYEDENSGQVRYFTEILARDVQSLRSRAN